MAIDGLVTKASAISFPETLSRLEAALKRKNMTVFARIDHAEGAAVIGLNLRPTTVMIFGNPMGGTPLMQTDQLIGLELPLKFLVWEDASGKVWMSYDDPAWLARRFALDPAVGQIAAMSAALAALAEAAGGSRQIRAD